MKTSGVCPQCWGTAVWSLSLSTSHTGDPTHSTWAHVTDSQCVQVTKTGHILTKSPFHGVLNWVRLGHGQGCPSLSCVPEHQSPGDAELASGTKRIESGTDSQGALGQGEKPGMPSRMPGPAGQWDLPGHLRQFIFLPSAGGFNSCCQGPHSLLLPMWLDSILKVLSNLNGSMISFWQPPGSHQGLTPWL